MNMHVPPALAGQIVEVAYGSDGEYAYRRVTDHGSHTLASNWSRVFWDDAWAAVDGTDILWEPWNQEPQMPVPWVGCDPPNLGVVFLTLLDPWAN